MTSHRRLSDSSNHQYHKKMGANAISNQAKKKSQKKKRVMTVASITEVKNKMKTIHIIPGEAERLEAKVAETEDLAESVDSGCIPDSSSDILADMMDTAQMEAALIEENRFISGLLRWLPAPLQSQEEPDPETRKGKKRKHEEKQIAVERGPGNKKQKVDVDVVGSHADLDQLQERYRSILDDLRKNRKKKWDHASKKKEAKLAKKLKVLERRKDKRTKNKVKLSVQPKINKEKKKQQSRTKNIRPQKPIYNQKGELVFSKFDFSNNSLPRDIDSNTKSKDLKQLLSQALKEKEKMKCLEKKGDKEGAISIAEQKAWSSALMKAEGKKVKSDVDMLKKSIKKQENRKKTSQKKWDQRLETVQKSKMDKQNQRKKNITSRKEAKLEKKMKRMKKKGHIVPGF